MQVTQTAGISRPVEAVDTLGDVEFDLERLELSDSLSRWGVRAAVWIGTATLVRLVVIATTQIANGESYYHVWSRFPSASYYDHPPLVAWMSWLTTRFSQSDFWVRSGPVVCAALFGALVYRLGERLFSARAGFIALTIVTLLPAFFVTSYALNPESPLAPLWVTALLLLEGMRRGREAWRPLVLGLVIGLAFLAKYSGVLLVGVALLWVAGSPTTRSWLKRPSFYAGGVVALLVTTPVLVWNSARGWPTLELHLVDRTGPTGVLPVAEHAFRVFVGQFGAFHPLALPGLLVALAVALRRSKRDERYRFLATASWPVLLFLVAMMVRVRDPESHWTMVGYVPLAVAAGGLLDESTRHRARWNAYVGACMVSSIVAIAYVYGCSQLPRLPRMLPAWMYDANKDPFNEMTGWSDVRTAIGTDASLLGPDTVVASCQYALCAHLLDAVDDSPRVYCPTRERSEFDFVGRREPPKNAPVLYVVDDHYHEAASARLPGRTCKPMPSVPIARDGVIMRTYRISACLPSGAR
jgi:hypothetical protein